MARLSLDIPDDWVPILRKAASKQEIPSVQEFLRRELMTNPKVIVAWQESGSPKLTDPRKVWGGRRKKDKSGGNQVFWGRPLETDADE